MTNSGVPSFPQPGQYRPEGHQRSAGDNDFQIGRLDRAPAEIRAEITAKQETIRLSGEITRVNQDGSVRIHTERGDIDVKLPVDERHQQRSLHIGQRVEIDVQPAPRPTSQATPEQPPQVTIRPAPLPVDTQTPRTQVQPQAPEQPTRTAATPVQIEVRDGRPVDSQPRVDAQIIRPPPTDPNAPPPPNRFPETGSLVRLEPVSPERLEQLVTNRQLIVAEVIRNTITQLPVTDVLLPIVQQPAASPVTTTVQTSGQTSPYPLQESLVLQAIAVIPPTTAPTQPATQQTEQTVLRPVTASLNTVFTAITAPSSVQSGTQINVKILTRAQAAAAQIQTLASPSTSIKSAISATPQDVRISQIQPPQVALSSPTTENAVPLSNFVLTETAPQNPVIGTQKSTHISGIVVAKTENQTPVVQFSAPQNTGAPILSGVPPLNTTATPPLNPVAQQTFILQFPSDALVLGSRIDVTPQTLITSGAQTNGIAPTLTSALPVLPYANVTSSLPWPIMQEIQQSLLQSAAHGATQTAQAFTNSLPNPANAAQFGSAALFFVAAARGGDLSSWLGDKASDILRSTGKNSLLSRLTGDIGTGRSAPEAPQSEWRGLNIPLFWDGDIQKIALHYKHDSQGKDHDKSYGNKGTRFIFDLNLEALGKVQLDGFFRPVSSDGPRLDLVLRTEERFSGSMQAEMRRIYMDAIKPSQVGGELSFQDGTDAWVMIDAQSDSALGVSA